MKYFLFATILVGVLISCKTNEPFQPTCTNVTLEKVDWTYCRLHNNSYPVKCNNQNDTLTLQVSKKFNDIKATIIVDSPTSYCLCMDEVYIGIKEDGRRVNIQSLIVYNLPQCFKKDKLRVKISGDLRLFLGLNELFCGCGGGEAEPFELTKIEEIP